MVKRNITADEVREILDYNLDTGVLTWRKKLAKKSIIGHVAGNRRPDGYIRIMIHGVTYLAHRLAWLHYYGEFPAENIDHIDHNPSNNDITNLRDVSPQVNCQNRRMASSNTSGTVGVHFKKDRQKWVARIKISGEIIQLGGFDDITDAIEARKLAERKYGFHENHGRA